MRSWVERGREHSSMTGPHTVERQRVFEHLAGAVSLHGWKDFEVSLDSDEFRIERHGGRAACTVSMLPDESTFHAHFAFATRSTGAYPFTISEQFAPGTGARRFQDVDQAARWLLEFLESGV